MTINISEKNIAILQQVIGLYCENKLHPAIIFHGNRGVGKSTLVQHIIKQMLNIHNLVSPNILMLSDKEDKSISISAVRNAIDWAMLSNDDRILLIDTIDLVSINGINALLKLVEEPPQGLYIFLITSKLSTLPQTIKSRCLKINIPIPTLPHFSSIITGKTDCVDEGILKYLYDVFEGDVNSAVTVVGKYNLDFINHSHSVRVHSLLQLMQNYDGNLVKILLFELVSKSRNCNSKERYEIVEKFEYISKKIIDIEKHHLSANAVLSSIISFLT